MPPSPIRTIFGFHLITVCNPRSLANLATFNFSMISCGCLRLSLSTFASAGCWNGSRPKGSAVGVAFLEETRMLRVASSASICLPRTAVVCQQRAHC